MSEITLVIAEKPSVANAIVAELGQTSQGDGYKVCGNTRVIACFGHMLEYEEPDYYTADDVPVNSNGNKVWRTDELPIIPDKWVIRPVDDKKKQVETIGKLIKEASLVIHAGDPDREGQLIVDELLDYFDNKSPVKRYWSSAVDSASVKYALENLKDNQDYISWGKAAEARGKADWLIGMNLSRAYTLRAERGGTRALLSVGRVQTPTLALVVNRDHEIENFKPIPFHTLKAAFTFDGISFTAAWKADEQQPGLDSEGRLVDTQVADKLVKTLTGLDATVSEYKQEKKKKLQPAGLAGADLTLLASKQFGYSADAIAKTTQSLYETHKLTSYPRSDCSFLPESQYAEASQVLEALLHVNKDMADLISKADISIKSKIWNDKKVTAHHAIIPTLHKGSTANLSEMELNIYKLIVRSYLAQFFPPQEFMKTSLVLTADNQAFVAGGKVVTSNGWTDVYIDDEDDDKNNQSLPSLSEGQALPIESVTRTDSKTKPPARFTEGTLMKAMINIHRFVTDPAYKEILKEEDGIGTIATQPATITELFKKGFIEPKGKALQSTLLGKSTIAALPEIAKSPALTALFDRVLKGIELGNEDMAEFVRKQEEFVKSQVAKANDGSIAIAGAKKVAEVSTVHKCKECGKGLIRRKGAKGFWWGCSGYPDCTASYLDLKGKPKFKTNKAKN